MPLARVQTTIINHLESMGFLVPEKAEEIRDTDEELSGNQLEKLLMEEYKVSEFQILVARGRAFDLHPVNAKNLKVTETTFEHLDKDFCQENGVLPLGFAGSYIIVAIHDPFNMSISAKIAEQTQMKACVLLGMESQIKSLLRDKDEAPQAEGFGDVFEQLGEEYQDADEEDGGEADEESGPIIQLANRIIEDAYFSGGSDIHIDPFEHDTRIRVRVDGVCQEKLRVPRKVSSALMARLKVMSNLDIAEKRLPQDGRIVFKQFTKKNIDIDLRVSTAPLNHGEGGVMRILDKQKSTLPLPALGFEPENLERYRELIRRPYGMILHCGPTGSGKSMTLYSALNEINDESVCIRTAEDPIEYTLPGLNQMQMQKKIGLTFSSALRSFLRQDPDIILVGEIRDQETAEIAVEAALTGHMLFSTLHTNDAPGTVARFTEMGVEPFMISASLVAVCAQRLMRRVCKTCKQQYIPEGNEADILWRAIKYRGPVFKATASGCPACKGRGYKGRVGIHEMMWTTEDIVAAINQEVETAELKKVALREGMATLHQDSMKKVRAGITTMEESLGTVPPDMEDLDTILQEHALKAELKRRKEEEERKQLADLRAENAAKALPASPG